MKWKVTWIFVVIVFMFTSCMSKWNVVLEEDYSKREIHIVKIYEKLSKKYDKLLENPIKEKERKELEETFQNFYDNLNALQVKNDSAHLQFLEKYRNYVRIKLNYLRDRSEEHTSELQSRQYLVCRLLLEKKKPSTSR